jgi:hypothetical protein
MNSAAGDHLVSGFEAGQQLLLLFLPFLLRPDQQKIENDEHEDQRRKRH